METKHLQTKVTQEKKYVNGWVAHVFNKKTKENYIIGIYHEKHSASTLSENAYKAMIKNPSSKFKNFINK